MTLVGRRLKLFAITTATAETQLRREDPIRQCEPMDEPTDVVCQFHAVPSFVDAAARDSEALDSPSHALGRNICSIGSATLVYCDDFLRKALGAHLRPVALVIEEKHRLEHNRIEAARSLRPDLLILNREYWKNP